MKRLLIIEDAIAMGGVQHSTINLLLGLKKGSNYQSMVLIPGEGTFTRECKKHSITYKLYLKPQMFSSSVSIMNDKYRLPNIPGMIVNAIMSRYVVNNLLAEIHEFNPDIVITKGMWAHINGGKACRKAAVPCIWHLQDFISERYFGFFRILFGFLASRIPTFIIADGTPIRSQLPVSAKIKCKVVFNGVPLDTFYQPEKREYARAELDIPKEAYVIGHIGRITPWKGQHILLDSFIKYASINPASYLLLIGSPLFCDNSYFESLKRRIANSGLSDRVRLPGYRSDLGYLLSAIDTFIYPSLEKDTSPLSLISALAAGLPVGVSNIPGLREMVAGCSGVICFAKGSIYEIIEIIDYYSVLENRKNIVSINRNWSQAHFSLESYVDNVEYIFKKVASYRWK